MPSKTQFQRLIENAGHETRSYSGRAMYGAKCLGVELDIKIGRFISDVLDALGSEDDKARDAANEAAIDAFRTMKTDSMGQGTILYFESIQYVGDEDDTGDEGDDEVTTDHDCSDHDCCT